MDKQELIRLKQLIQNHRWAALASQGETGPEASWVAYAPEAHFSGFLLHLSQLAAHTRNLLHDPRACLAISEQERPGEDPQLLVRVMIQGRVAPISPETSDYIQAGQCYRERLPDSEPLFAFRDFVFLRLTPSRIRLVTGFGHIYSLDPEVLQQAAG